MKDTSRGEYLPPHGVNTVHPFTGVQIVHLSYSLLRYCRSASHNQTSPPTRRRCGSFP